ncbi:MAG: invasion associated locus B family protein [Halocynthiibacter sp.]
MTTIDSFMTVKGIKKPLWLATAAVREIIGTEEKSILFRVPLQVRLKEGMLIRIDDGNVSRVEFQFCQDVGCWVVLPANDKLIGNFKKGKKAILQFSDMRGKTHQVEITLAGFTKAYKGKASKILKNPAPAPAKAKKSRKGDAPAN